MELDDSKAQVSTLLSLSMDDSEAQVSRNTAKPRLETVVLYNQIMNED